MKVAGLDLGPMRPRRPRTPRRYFAELTGGAPLYPAAILFGLNAVDELDRAAFGILLPNIRDHFGLSDGGALALVSVVLLGALLLEIPLAYFADRLPRARIAVAGAATWAVFGVLTGLATTLLVLVIARTGTGIGRAVVTPTHNSLLSDYYPIEKRADIFGFHRMANAVGNFLGPLFAGLFAYWWGWRAPFIIFVVPTLVLIVLGLRLREPKRGTWERAAAGADAATVQTDEVPPSFAESVRILWQVRTLRRIWMSLPFLASSVIGLVTISALYYESQFGLDELQRGLVGAFVEPAQVVGIMLGIPLAARLMLQDPGLGLRLLSIVAVIVAAAFTVFALTPVLWLAILMNLIVTGVAAILAPGVYASLSLAIPPKVRSLGFSMSSLFILPGVLVLLVVGWIADNWGLRQGMLVMVPVFLIGGWILSSASVFVRSDINRVWTSTAAQAEVRRLRDEGIAKQLLVRNVDVSYDGVQVLFGVNLEIDEGEVVALLGTNGAGKSTLLKAISGLVEAENGAVIFDGRDMTYAPPHEVAARGVVQVPGGQGVFPGLTVAENLRLAGWLRRRDAGDLAVATERVLDLFPVLRERLDEPAGHLSGGQQQMLTLGMAFVTRPRLLMIDELSLGLAPAIVEQLLGIVRELAAGGTTIIVVEQSVNVALTLAETAYFMEKGEIRFHGPTAELLERPDVLRSVFLEGAATATADRPAGNGDRAPAPSAVPDEVPAGLGDPTGAPARARPNGGPASPPILPAAAPARLEVQDVSKRFGGVHALTEVSVSVGAGEIVGFLGPNGAGKTTLFDVISGFLPADGGSIVLRHGDDARDIVDLPAHARARLGLGRSFQDGRLFPQLTVAETIAVALERQVPVRDPVAAALHLPAVVESETRVTARVEELLELLGITDFRDKLVRELSTGSRRVVDLACIVAHAPTVILLDEPSSGIAQREAEALGPLLSRLRDQTGASILLIEHDVPLLLRTVDRLVALDLGQVVTSGPPDEVVHHPDVVASYLGTTGEAIARSGPG